MLDNTSITGTLRERLAYLVAGDSPALPVYAYWLIREYGDELLKALDDRNAAPRIEAAFGLGQVAVTLGEHGGRPCVYLAPARVEGKNPGDSVDNASEGLEKDSMRGDESVLTFPTAQQARRVQYALCGVKDEA
jgi:hypothetical protein